MAIASDTKSGLVVAEYSSLRQEILKLIELQAQLISLSVVALGALLSFAFQVDRSEVAFAFPVLSAVLGLTWLNHSHTIARCANYIAESIERRHFGEDAGWEQYVRRTPLRYGTLGYWGVRSTFVGTSIVALVAGWSLYNQGNVESTLAIVASVVTVAEIVLFTVWREPSPKVLVRDSDAQLKPSS